MRMTAEDRRVLGPIMDRIDAGYTKFRFFYTSGDCIEVEFEMYHEPYYDDDEFEIDFRVTKIVKRRIGEFRKGDYITVGKSSHPDDGFMEIG